MKKLITLLLLAFGAAAAVVLWRSQQARDTATQAFDGAKGRLPQANTPSATSGTAGQPNRSSSTPATTTRLSQTAPDAGVSMSGSATLASDESSIAQPVFRAAEDAEGAQANATHSSQAEQHYATVDNVIESSHQPDATEASDSSAQIDAPASSAAAQPARPGDMDVVPGDDPDAGQLMADGEDRTITDRIRSRLGQELDHKGWGHLNINTQAMGDVYLRGYVVSDELRSQIEQIVGETEGVQSVVNELNVEEQNKA